MKYSKKIANFIEKLDYRDIPKETVQKAKYCFIDWLGAVYAAYKSPLAEKYINFARNLGNEGEHLIIGSSYTTSLPWSIFANAALGHIAEVDDGHRTSIIHPGAVVMPVAFELGLDCKLTGKEILTSIVAGYDVAIRIGECLGDQHYTIWHTTATAGTFGATAAAAKIYNLKQEEIVNALGHAGTQASGLWQFLLDGAVDAKAFLEDGEPLPKEEAVTKKVTPSKKEVVLKDKAKARGKGVKEDSPVETDDEEEYDD